MTEAEEASKNHQRGHEDARFATTPIVTLPDDTYRRESTLLTTRTPQPHETSHSFDPNDDPGGRHPSGTVLVRSDTVARSIRADGYPSVAKKETPSVQ